MRKWVSWGALLAVLVLPAVAAAATDWIPIPTSYAPKLRTTVVKPAVRAVGGGARITSCSFQQRRRFYVCIYGTQSAPKQAAIEVERTKRCDYTVLNVQLAGVPKPKVTHHTSFHHCY